jgi:hypothetical protein
MIGDAMPSIYRISRSDQEPVVDVGSVEAIEGAVGAGETGRMARDMHIRPGSGTTEEGHFPTGPGARFVASAWKFSRPTA